MAFEPVNDACYCHKHYVLKYNNRFGFNINMNKTLYSSMVLYTFVYRKGPVTAKAIAPRAQIPRMCGRA